MFRLSKVETTESDLSLVTLVAERDDRFDSHLLVVGRHTHGTLLFVEAAQSCSRAVRPGHPLQVAPRYQVGLEI